MVFDFSKLIFNVLIFIFNSSLFLIFFRFILDFNLIMDEFIFSFKTSSSKILSQINDNVFASDGNETLNCFKGNYLRLRLFILRTKH